MNSGHRNRTNQSYSVQTPAVRLNIVQNQVYYFNLYVCVISVPVNAPLLFIVVLY